MAWHSFVAVGDSFTEGMNDHDPSGNGFRGWADLVAERLAAEAAARGEEFHYANLAIRGRLFNAVVDEQLSPTLAMRPDLVSFAAGGNDALRPNFDGPALVARFEEVLTQLRSAGADVILFRFADLSRRLPGRRIIVPRASYLNDAAAEVAARQGAFLVDLWSDEELSLNTAMWSEDRLHLSTAGHHRVAGHVLTALGLIPDPTWMDVPPAPRPLSWPMARAADARWTVRYLAPWVKRRVQGRSSGDLVTAKRPELAPVLPPTD
ncbi:SGNH/GDSL hydrolase family protein [Planosporangium thailandense]|uniref:SGNH/GDSL hydrolase family protein n=1 Tax=Planosporangium thailandense TaxID=765197 RepID=A0ABX0XSK4_9ACTN|nr:SGNH/GDSL hydrolase family protein [Planosporangium thailandense]NJC68801.1 SGNH/GDSL hydrolase family protein [Planosporangium thailandense]